MTTRDIPILTKIGKQPTNCRLIKGPFPAGNKAVKMAKKHIAENPEVNCCNVDAAGMVTEWQVEVVDGGGDEVDLKNACASTTFYYTDKLPVGN